MIRCSLDYHRIDTVAKIIHLTFATSGCSEAHSDLDVKYFMIDSRTVFTEGDNALKMTESWFYRLQNCSGLEAARNENIANGHGGTLGRRLWMTVMLTIFRKRAKHGERQGF